jgi:hypothetical protein
MGRDDAETVGQLLGQCLQVLGARRVFGASSSGITGVPGLRHVRVDDPALAALLADAHGRITPGGRGVALLPGRRLRITSSPGQLVEPVVLDDPALLPEAIASCGLPRIPTATELVLDVDLDAPVPAGVVPLTAQAGDQLMTLSPSLAELRTLVLAGPGVLGAGQTEALRAFAEQSGFGVVNTWGAKGVFRWDDPHHHGTAGLQERDFELAGFGDAQLVIAVGVDPAEAPRELWAHGQVLEVEPWQLAALAYNWPEPDPVPPYPALYRDLSAALAPVYDDDVSPLTPARAARDLSRYVPEGAVVVADPGPAGLWVARAFPTTAPGSVIVPALPVSGFAVAAAVAAGLDDRGAVAIVTGRLDPTSEQLVELAGTLGSSFVLCEWGSDAEGVGADWADANAHRVALRSAFAAPGVSHVPVPVDFSWTSVLVDVAGPVRAWR